MVHVYLILVCYCISLYLNAEEQVMWVKSYFAAAEGWACTLCLELMYQTYCRGSSLTSWWMRQVWGNNFHFEVCDFAFHSRCVSSTWILKKKKKVNLQNSDVSIKKRCSLLLGIFLCAAFQHHIFCLRYQCHSFCGPSGSWQFALYCVLGCRPMQMNAV